MDRRGGGFQQPPKALRDAEHHVVSAMIKWVEEGIAPETNVATRFDNGKLARERPLCPYPKEALYKGSGDINVAASFSCVMPALDKLVATPTDILQIQNSLRQRGVLRPNR